jgi:hypothetical protein
MDSVLLVFVLNSVFFISFLIVRNTSIALILTSLILFVLLFIAHKKNLTHTSTILNSSNTSFNDQQYINAIICLIVLIGLEKIIGFNGSLFASFFIFAHLNKLNSRTSYHIALIFLGITAFLSINKSNRFVETTAIMSYYFLIIGVVWHFYERWKEKIRII